MFKSRNFISHKNMLQFDEILKFLKIFRRNLWKLNEIFHFETFVKILLFFLVHNSLTLDVRNFNLQIWTLLNNFLFYNKFNLLSFFKISTTILVNRKFVAGFQIFGAPIEILSPLKIVTPRIVTFPKIVTPFLPSISQNSHKSPK